MDEKEQRWQAMSEKCARITDALGKPIDPGIFETVVVFNLLGIRTKQSCEGHLERGRAYPWISMEARNLDALFHSLARMHKDIDVRLKERVHTHAEQAALYEPYHQQSEQAEQAVASVALPLQAYLQHFYTQRPTQEHHCTLFVAKQTVKTFVLMSQGAVFQVLQPDAVKQQRLEQYGEEMRAFTLFLKNVFFQQTE